MKLFTLALSLALATIARAQIPHCEEVVKIKEAIKEKFSQINLHPGTLRLGFHDCVDACDGCINLAIGSNAGLDTTVGELRKIYDDLKSGVSLADFWSLATVAAVEYGLELSNKGRGDGKKCPDFDLVPLFGRLDSKDCSVQTDAQFPNPTMTYSVMMDYFKKQLNMTDPEVVVLMGAHSLGGASPFASGYDGQFTGGGSSKHFDERYFSQMVDPALKWKNENGGGLDGTDTDKFVFNAFNATTDAKAYKMMFNTDFEMFYDLELDNATSAAKCNLNHVCSGPDSCAETDCKVSPMYGLSMDYAKNCDKFVTDFAKALDKMMKHGTVELKPCTNDPATSTAATDSTASTPADSAATTFATLQLGSLLLSIIAFFTLN